MWHGGAGQMPGVRTPVCVNQGSRGRRLQSTMGAARVRGDISIEQQQRAGALDRPASAGARSRPVSVERHPDCPPDGSG
jgi:hypothetical protein